MCADKCVDSVRAIVDPLVQLRTYLNQVLKLEPLVLVGGTAAACYIISCAFNKIPKDGVTEGFKRYLFKKARLIPSFRKEIDSQIAATGKEIEENLLKLYTDEGNDNPEFIVRLPCQGLSNDAIISKLEDYMNLGTYKWENNRVSGTVYHGGKELTELNTKVFSLAAWTNPLHPDVFPGVCKMEAEIVRIAAELFHGSDDACGTVTSGGTESIILAVKAYRDYAVRVRGISNPEILIPVTAHAAFDKAAELLNMRVKHVGISKATMKVRLDVMESMITKRTCMLVGSTPAFPHGCIDDIQSIAKLGLKYNIPLHVDACLGGFLLAFMPKSGFQVPSFDFSVDGVTSISADTHKYGFAPKGSSVLLFSDKKFRHHQYFVQTNWPGGIYATSTLAGSRPGVVIAGCWSSLLHFGLNGYTEITRKIINAARRIEAGLRDIPGIFVYGEPQVSVIAIGSDDFDIYRLADSLNKKGWSLNNLQFPSSVHICVTYRHTEEGVVDQFLKDVTDAVDIIKLNPQEKVSGAVALYATSQQIPDRSLVGDIITIYMDALYNTTKKGRDGGDTYLQSCDRTSKPNRENEMHLNGSLDLSTE
ncbi:unnamed protein product [Allacma fusca]|uniref:sphinganine-1-phosphate aldolase n=1 Tax=Allacma fusca TaxID=39272 RepID=A0A8J2LKE2_9HEXA|nr:unnamed protein product [Allacma fusca]